MITIHGYEKGGNEILANAIHIPKHELGKAIGGISVFSDPDVYTRLAWFNARKNRPESFKLAGTLGAPNFSNQQVYGQHSLAMHGSEIESANADGLLLVDGIDILTTHLYGGPLKEIVPGSASGLSHGDGSIPLLGGYVLAELSLIHEPAERMAWGLAFRHPEQPLEIITHASEQEAYQALRP